MESKQNKVKILIACHKPTQVYQDDVYIPIHVGRAISKYQQEMADMIGDDTGDNISAKNPYYCELTAQYWAWKNLKDVEYIGLCHYRRFFQKKITPENIDSLLGNRYDALCVQPLHETIATSLRLVKSTCLEDFQIFMVCLKRVHPEYFDSVKKFLRHGVVIPYNMFVMGRDLFEDFATWQFAVFSEMEKYVRYSGYTRARRLYGYFAEMLLPIYLFHNKKKIKYLDWASEIGGKVEKPLLRRIRCLKNDILLKLSHPNLNIDGEDVIVGFKADGIPIGYVEKAE